MSDQDRAFLKDEYLKLQDQYEDYDRRSLQIKGWVSAGAAIAVGTGLGGKEPFSAFQWFAIGALALCIWYLEARWKQFQYALAGRIQAIEAHFRKPSETIYPLQMYDSWFENYRAAYGFRYTLKAAWQDFVMLPYVLIIAIAAVGATLSQ